MKRKVISLCVILAMLLSFLPTSSLLMPAAVASDLDMDALTALGIDTSKAPDGYDPYSTDNPYGKNTIQITPVQELYKVGLNNVVQYEESYTTTGTLQNGQSVVPHTATYQPNSLRSVLYGNEAWGKNETAILTGETIAQVASGQTSATGDYTLVSTGTVTDAAASNIPAKGYLKGATKAYTDLENGFRYAMSAVAAGNFDGNNEGLEAQTVMVYTSEYSPNGGLYLRLGNATGGVYGSRAKELLSTTKKIGNPELTYEGKLVENFAENPYQLQNYLEVATGDWNNDGLDEVAVYIPEENNSRIVVFALQLTSNDNKAEAFLNPDKWSVVWTYYLREAGVVSNMVSFTSGDVNMDGTDDLAATWGYYYGPEQNKGSKAVVMFGDKGTRMLQKSQEFDLNYGSSNIVRASFAFGDMAGANSKVLILCGQSDADLRAKNTQTRYVALYDWNGVSFQSNVYQNFNLFEKDDEGAYTWTAMGIRVGAAKDKFYSLPLCTSNTAMISQGISGGGDLLYFDSLIMEYTEQGLNLKEAWDNTQSMQEDVNSCIDYVEYGAVAGDLTGVNGAGTVITMSQTLASEKIETASYTVQGTYQRPIYERTYYYKSWFHRLFDIKTWITVYKGTKTVTDSSRIDVDYPKLIMGKTYMVAVVPTLSYHLRVEEDYSASICLANTDKDSSYMSYGKNHYYTYTDPQVLAVLASPPYFADLLDRDDLSGNYAESTTRYASTEGSGTGSTLSATITVGAYVSYEHDFKVFGVTVASVEAEVAVTAGFTFDSESTSTLEQTVAYTAAAGEDMVAFYSIPMEIYEYTSFVADGQGGYDAVLTAVNIPHKAAVRLLSLEEYEFIAKDYSVLPKIADNVLTHEIGNPASYPTSTDGYSVIAQYDKIPSEVGFSSAGGGSSISQEITMTKEDSSAFTISGAIEAKAGAGAGGFKVGVIAGAEVGGGSVTISTHGSSFSGEMQNMPIEAQPYGYGMKWRIFCYGYVDGASVFPVVSYLVSEVKNPPPLPQDFTQNMSETTADSITLDWSYDANIAGFRIYRYYEFPEGSGSYEVSFVPFTRGIRDAETGTYHFSYKDENLNPYTEYSYQIKAVRASNPKESIYSEPLICRTKTAVGYPVIRLAGLVDGVLPIYPDADSTVALSIDNPATYDGLSYQWQTLADGTWVSLSGKTASSFTIRNAGAVDDGLYRCRVNTIYYDKAAAQTYYISAYSDVFSTTYAKRTPIGKLTAQEVTVGTDLGLKTEIELYSANRGHSVAPSGKVTFTVQGTDYAYSKTVLLNQQTTEKYFADIGETKRYSTASLTLPSLPEGVYTVSAYYSGSRIFKDNELPDEILVVIGSGTAYKLDLASTSAGEPTTKFTYGENIWPTLASIGKDSDGKVVATPLASASYKLSAVGGAAADFAPGSVTPNVGSYILTGYDGSSDPVVSQSFVVSKKAIAVAVENQSDVYAGTVSTKLPKIVCAELDASQLAALKLSYATVNTAGNPVVLNNDTEPGNYRVTAATSSATPLELYNNYSVTYVTGSYTIVGSTHWLELEALPYTAEGATRPVGTAGISSQSNTKVKYTAGNAVLVYATPQLGYEVDRWTARFADNTEIEQARGNTFVVTTQAQDVKIEVTFKPADIKLVTLVEPSMGGAITCSDAFFTSPAIVAYGAEYDFTAIPSTGYHFKAWRIITGGTTTTSVGMPNTDGTNNLTVTVGAATTTVYADFERDAYTLELVGDITAYYMFDHDGVSTTPPIKRTVTSGAAVAGDTVITVEPKVGYGASEGATFTLNGAAKAETEHFVFAITENSVVALDTIRNNYAVTIISDNGSVIAEVNGEYADDEALAAVAGGSTIKFTVRAERGFVFDHWVVNEVDGGQNATLTIPELGEGTVVSAVFTANTAYTANAVTSNPERGSLGYTLYDIYGELVGEATTPMPETGVEVFAGETITFIATIVPGSMMEQWQVNAANIYTTQKTYTVDDVSSDLVVVAYLKAASSYAVHFAAQGGNGGLVGMSDGQTMTSGGLQYGGSELEFLATPAEGYMLDYWTITPGDVSAPQASAAADAKGVLFVDPVYSINPLRQNVTVRAYFRQLEAHTVTLLSGGLMGRSEIIYTTPVMPTDNGVPSEVNQATVRDGGTVKMTFAPTSGHATSEQHLRQLLLADGVVNADAVVGVSEDNGTYTVTVSNLTQGFDLSQMALFYEVYSITVADLANGSITVAPTIARAGELASLTVAPSSGFRLAALTLEPLVGLSPEFSPTVLQYVFVMPSEGVLVSANFEKIPAPPPPSGGEIGGGGGVNEPPLVAKGETAAGRTTYEVNATAGLIPAIVTAKSRGQTTVELNITGALPEGAQADVLSISVPQDIVKHLSGLDVVLNTPYGVLGLPRDLVMALAASGQEISVIMQAGSSELVQTEIGEKDELLTEPVDISTALRGEVNVTLPCHLPLPTDAAEREAFLANLYVLAIHDADDKEQIGALTFEIDEQTNTLLAISFEVEHFSTFALVFTGQETEEPAEPLQLHTLINGTAYTIAAETKPFDNLTAYRALDGTTVMAVRLLQELGAQIGYTRVDNVGVVTVVFGDTKAILQEKSTLMSVVTEDGTRQVKLRTAFTNYGGRTYLPTRDVAENLGFAVHWTAADDSITITTK